MDGHRTTTATTLRDGTDGQRTDDDGTDDETEGRTLDDSGDVTDTTGRTDTLVMVAILFRFFLYVFNIATTFNRHAQFQLFIIIFRFV